MRDGEGADLVENPDGMVVGPVEELVEGRGIIGLFVPVIDEVFAGILGVVRPRVLW